MSKRILALIGILMALGLTACNQNTANNMNNQRKANTQKQGLTTKLNAPEQASAFIIYAAMKYKGHWQKLYQRAQATKLSVSVKKIILVFALRAKIIFMRQVMMVRKPILFIR